MNYPNFDSHNNHDKLAAFETKDSDIIKCPSCLNPTVPVITDVAYCPPCEMTVMSDKIQFGTATCLMAEEIIRLKKS